MKCIQAVLFDFDGVLIDSLECMESAWIKTKKKYSLSPEFSDYVKHIGKPFPIILADLKIEKSLHEDIAREYSALASSGIHLINEMPYSRDIVDWLFICKIKVALVTSKSEARTFQLIEKFSLKFDCVVTPELTSRGKPFPDPILYALSRLQVPKDNAVFIGDMNTDMNAAKTADVKYLHYNNGYECLDPLPYGGCIHSLLEIQEYVKYF